MLNGQEIAERALSMDGSLPANVSEALRKSRQRGTMPSLPTLRLAAEHLGTTVSYLIGETDETGTIPVSLATADDQKSDQSRYLKVSRMNASPDYETGWVGMVLDAVGEQGEVKLLLTYDAAALGARSLALAVDQLDEHRLKTDTPS